MLVMPPFASAGLTCYTATGEIDSMAVTRDFAVSHDYIITIKIRNGDTIAYFSDLAEVPGPATLVEDGITVVITPRAIMTVNANTAKATLATVACVPVAEEPDYSSRFAVDPRLLRDALEDAILRVQRNLRYEN